MASICNTHIDEYIHGFMVLLTVTVITTGIRLSCQDYMKIHVLILSVSAVWFLGYCHESNFNHTKV